MNDVERKIMYLLLFFMLAGLADTVTTAYIMGIQETVIVPEHAINLSGDPVLNGVQKELVGVERNSFFVPFLATAVLGGAVMFGFKISKCKRAAWIVGLCVLAFAWTGAINNIYALSIVFS